MARLVIKTAEVGERVIELNLGVNDFGRTVDNHFQIAHPTVSAKHCEITLTAEGVTIRDCASTNGTFVAGQQIQEARLSAGQSVHLGEVELFVDNTDVTIAIPKFDLPCPAPPVVRADGSLMCPRHPKAIATHRCTHCQEILCDACVHWLRRRGGKLMKFCPICSHPCVLIRGEKPKKKGLRQLWDKTVKLAIGRARAAEPE